MIIELGTASVETKQIGPRPVQDSPVTFKKL